MPVVPVTWWIARSVTNQVLQVPTTRTNHGEKAISVRGPTFWNLIPNHVFDVRNHNTFTTHSRGKLHASESLGDLKTSKLSSLL